MPGVGQQPRGAAHDGKDIAVLPNQLHLGLLGAIQQLVEFGHVRHITFQFKIVFLPEMDAQLAVANVNLTLFKAFTPTVAVLASNVGTECGLLFIRQRRIRIDPQGADQFSVHLIHIRNSADDLAADRIVLGVILHQVAAEVVDILVDGIADNIAVAGQFLASVRDALVLVVAVTQILGVVREKVCGQRRIKFHLHRHLPLFSTQIVVNLGGIVIFYRQWRIVECRQ